MSNPIYVEYPNMTVEDLVDFDYYFNELVIYSRNKQTIFTKISSVFAFVSIIALFYSPFYFNLPFLFFIQQTTSWPIIILTLFCFISVFGDGNYCKKALQESIENKNYKYLSSQVRGYEQQAKDGLYVSVNSLLIEGFIALLTYIAYSNYFFFGLNYLLAGLFFIAAIAIKYAFYISLKDLKINLKQILKEKDISIKDLAIDVENWKLNKNEE